MRKQVTLNTKEHYKSYKAGKNWVFACVTVAALSLGVTGMSATASADTTGNISDTPNTDNQAPAAANDIKSSTTTLGAGNTNDPKNAGADKDVTSGTDKDTGSGTDQDAGSDVNHHTGDITTHKVTNPDGSGSVDDNLGKVGYSSRAKLVKDAETPTYDASSVQGVNATEWLKDDGLRSLVEFDLQKSFNPARGITVTDDNLYQYIDQLSMLYTDGYTGTLPTTFEGLQYFKNLTYFSFTGDVDPANYVNFSFAPNLTHFAILSKDQATSPVDASTFMNNVLGENTALNYLYIVGYHLTGNLPNLTNYKDLNWINLSSNELTGGLENMGPAAPETSLNLADNKLSGPITEADLTNINSLYISHNDFSGNLPVLRPDIIVDAQQNHFTSGQQSPTSNQTTMNQILTGGTFTITPKNRTFDPLTDLVAGVRGADGVTFDTTDPMQVYGWSNGKGSLFTVTADPTNPIGFNLTANADVPDGTYRVWALNSKTSQYAFSLEFTIVNGKDPIIVVTPPTTGTTTTPTDNGGSTVTTPVTGGDGATITTGTPTKGGAAAKVTGKKVTTPTPKKGAAAAKVTASKGNRVTYNSMNKNPKTDYALKLANHADTNKNATTLPQTNEKSSVSAIVAGVAMVISILGLGASRKRHE
ncbi:hypothetical protein FD13_GL001937 [Levilactobacillus senmaizukei DSM 21775 = NBRC 103853]|uniref:Gram-positive cocci surface proteins LPxTG domain-containing protein n=1 Tax=Levilactobacillus senmaizukei DSM 21775 = NBRC 103853 TaxID=1423803 RepID=A0A0R2DRD0_9LACO|nr:KxYKxGKxW signal peptide domain-containing protein [Levilactobacillus senmaizukei]KRN02484.1 hypothetical protein FD13_GL001937 [Levilactobacillus senmaizukei DSM 21775 = NBRC 103853]